MSYLTFKANSSSTPSTFTPNWAGIGAGGMQYRAVGATEWSNATQGTAITVDTVGIELKADTIRTGSDNHFSMTGSISASGDITSLTNEVGGDCALAQSCYYDMFRNCTSLTTAPILPSTTLNDCCYQSMFGGCQSLTVPPELPATTLVKLCYYQMFINCFALTVAPELPATTLDAACYYGMFSNCQSLIIAPKLPSTILANSCYNCMFQYCTSLIAVPELPATTLTEYCYACMFYGCTSLTTVPELPATTLAPYCYGSMFNGCTSLIGYITAEPGYTLIHNYPETSAAYWNWNTYANINSVSTVPDNPLSNTNYYFKPASPPTPTPSITGKRLECFGHDQHEIKP